MSTAYIALGSNLDNPAAQLRQAFSALHHLHDTTVSVASPVYRSTAVGPGEQNDYLNAVVAMATQLTPLALLEALQALEQQQGRVRTIRWGPRTLDLDILLYDQLQMDTPVLTIPHVAIAERNFVLYPLADITGPEFVLPNGAVLDTLLSRCPRGDLQLSEHRLDDSKKEF
ncbi:MAG: 2-amino-4-hydroxy-6-hydroxymethyldihydropteridine diphosphokinase [Halioglobus sp.]